jgi:hypothetical protein
MMGMKIGETTRDTTMTGTQDAFHMHAVLVQSDKPLDAGDNVRFTDNTFTKVERCGKRERHAIVDPFAEIGSGELFWVLLAPNKTSNLSHKFDIDIEDVKKVSKEPPPPPAPPRFAPRLSYDEDRYDDECRGC